MLQIRSIRPLLGGFCHQKLCRERHLDFVRAKSTAQLKHDEKILTAERRDEGDNTDVDTAKRQSKASRARLPLIKNFFVGVVDKELLAYPEVIARDEMSELINEVLPFKNFFDEELDAKKTISPALLESARGLGLYGINVPQDFNGKGWDWSKSLMACESESKWSDFALGLLSHRVVIDVLSEMGTAEQQQRFLSKLGNGDLVGTEAIFEEKSSEEELFNCSAEFMPESKQWILNGEKAFVVTGPLPSGAKHLFLVVAQTRRPNVSGDNANSTTVFLVESSLKGIEVRSRHETIGFRDVQISQVSFKDVVLLESCILGLACEGNQVTEVLLRSGRLRTTAIGLGIAKSTLNELVHYCLGNKQCGVLLKDMEMVQMHMSRALCATYAIESMLYFTAGLLDEFERQDVGLEAAITKYFALTELSKLASISIDVIGAKALTANEKTEVIFRNVAQLRSLGEPVDGLRLYIALAGLQYASAIMADTVQKSRNPMFHPGHIFNKFLSSSNIDNPKSKMRLGENVHPSLEPAAQCIEQSVARLQMCVELLFTRYGREVVERHSEMGRLCEMSSAIYAMFASTARASRSYCIGLHLADHELLVASTICNSGRDLVKMLCAEIFDGQYLNNDNNLQRLSSQVFKSKGYFATHPLSYNY